MKTVDQLNEIRQKTLDNMNFVGNEKGYRILVGMATCGVAAGAVSVYDEMCLEIEKRKLHGVEIIGTGCIGICRLEPIVEVYAANNKRTTYVKVKSEMVGRIITEHIVNGNVVEEYTIEGQSTESPIAGV